MLMMKDVSKVYRTERVETHALRDLLLEEHTGGHFVRDGVDVENLDDRARSRLRNEKIGFVFQSFNLIPDLNLFDNVDVPLRYRGLARGDRKRRIEKALE